MIRRRAQASHQVFILFLLAGKLGEFFTFGGKNNNLAIARATGSTHALNGANDVHDVEKENQINTRNIQSFFTNRRCDERVQRTGSEIVQRPLLLFLRLTLCRSTVAASGAALFPSRGVALTDELGHFNFTRGIRTRGNFTQRANDILDALTV